MTGTWKNRIVSQGEEAPDQLLANPKNWRIHPQHQQAALEGVLDDVGWVQQVIVNQRTATLIDGHLRVSLALRRNEPRVPVVYVDLSEAEEALILATLDPLAALAATDSAQLDALLREVSSDSAAVMQMLDDMAGAAGLAAALDTLTDTESRPKTPEEKLMDYTAGAIKQIVLYFDQRQYVDVQQRLERVCTDHGLDSNTDAFLKLLEYYEAPIQ